MPVVQKKAAMILNLVGIEIAEKGKRYHSGDREDDVFTLPCYLFETSPAVPDAYFKRVLRVLICDPDGKYPWEDGCDQRRRETGNGADIPATVLPDTELITMSKPYVIQQIYLGLGV